MRKLLIANRGEIAMRVARAARDLGLPTVAIYAEDDAQSRHRQITDEAVALKGSGPQAYIDMQAVVDAARRTGADAIHPGYGFLSERADFAALCDAAGIAFVGPTPQQLAQFGDKAIAIALARACQVPVMASTPGSATLADIEQFFDAQGGSGIVIKAVGGGGGRGMRVVRERGDIAAAYARCQSEAKSAFGVEAVYAERLVVRARHIEVQIVGDGQRVLALGERDCTLQRRFQKLVEMAPSPRLNAGLRAEIVDAARRMAAQVGYRSLGTFEFLVEEDEAGKQLGFVFIEANPRLQVEHTVTEQVTGVDLVELQLKIAQGKTFGDLNLNPDQPPPVRGFAIQVRVNGESTDAQGQSKPSHGQLLPFDPPAGPGVRVDTHGYTGYTPSPLYDTLLAKLIVSSPSPDFAEAVRRLQGALAEFRIGGVQTNLALLRAMVATPDFASQNLHTRYLEAHLPALLEQAQAIADKDTKASVLSAVGTGHAKHQAAISEEQLDDDSLIAVRAPTNGTLIELQVADGDLVHAGQTVAIIESMKMQHEVVAPAAGRVVDLRGKVGAVVPDQAILYVLDPVDHAAETAQYSQQADENHIRPDLQRVIDRHAFLWDENRPEAVKRRRSRTQRTARENVADLLDADGSFVEYGGLAIAAQAKRRTVQDLIANTPADGLITGVGNINGTQVAPERARAAVMAYDATVLAGTQGKRNHIKTDRIVEIALRDKLPFVLFGEGGGGRPGDVDFPSISGFQTSSFASFAQLSGEVPVVGIVSGRCFAGNAAFVGCCDVIIADKSSNIGLAGPAMIEGGGLGIFTPEEVGPAPVQYANGVIDVLVENEIEAVQVAKHYLSFFQGRVNAWTAPNPLALRNVVPENRLRAYDSRAAIHGIGDEGSVLLLREGFGIGIHTALARIEGRPVGIMANNPRHLGGAIDADAGDKAARFMQLCDAHGLPIVSLIDSPGFMVGPDIEAQAQVRHVSRMFVAAAKLRMPILAVTLRKCYGLGAMAMAGGGWHASNFTVAWPTGEYGPMGLEGAIQLGFKKELEAVPDGPERRALYDQLVAQMYERGHAMNVAGNAEIDAVIDPADTRKWLISGIHSADMHAQKPRRGFVDTW